MTLKESFMGRRDPFDLGLEGKTCEFHRQTCILRRGKSLSKGNQKGQGALVIWETVVNMVKSELGQISHSSRGHFSGNTTGLGFQPQLRYPYQFPEGPLPGPLGLLLHL